MLEFFNLIIDNGENSLNIQDGINEAKKEFSSDEQMLASAFKVEKFYKKHKIKIFSVVALAVLFFGGKAVMAMIEENKLESANDAYLVLTKDAENKEALATLKSENPALFELYTYQQAIDTNNTEVLKGLSSSTNTIIADIASYHLSLMENKTAKSELYNEMALVYNASLFIKEGKMIEAQDELAQIDEASPVYNISKIIKHYTIKGH